MTFFQLKQGRIFRKCDTFHRHHKAQVEYPSHPCSRAKIKRRQSASDWRRLHNRLATCSSGLCPVSRQRGLVHPAPSMIQNIADFLVVDPVIQAAVKFLRDCRCPSYFLQSAQCKDVTCTVSRSISQQSQESVWCSRSCSLCHFSNVAFVTCRTLLSSAGSSYCSLPLRYNAFARSFLSGHVARRRTFHANSQTFVR